MGEYESRTKQATKSTATAGPSQDDRYGAGLVGQNMAARIIKVDIVDGGTLVTIAKGKLHGVHADMEGYVTGGAGGSMLAELTIQEVRQNTCTATVDVTPDRLRGYLEVVIAPTMKPTQALTANTNLTRVIGVSLEEDPKDKRSKPKVIIPRGSSHGVTPGSAGTLLGEDRNTEGASFEIGSTSAMLSFAYINETIDHVNQHKYVRIHLTSSSGDSGGGGSSAGGRGAVQRRASGAASTADVQSTAAAGVAV